MLKRVEPSQSTAPEVGVVASAGLIDLDHLWAAVRRQARVVMVAAFVGLLLGLAYIVTAVPQYTATSRILIDSQKDKRDVSAIDSRVDLRHGRHRQPSRGS